LIRNVDATYAGHVLPQNRKPEIVASNRLIFK
jgi:hypothetical protein